MTISRISTYSQFLFSQRVLQNNEQQRQLYSTRLSTGRKFLELSRYRGSMTDLIKFGAENERLEETRSALTTVDAVLSKYNSLIESQSSDGQFSGLVNLVDTWLGQLAEARTSVIGQQQDKLDDWQRAVRNPLENALRTITSTLNTELAGRRIFAGGGDARYRQPPSIDLELATRAEGSNRAELAAYSGELLRQLEEDNEDRFDGFFTDDDPDARLSAGNRLSVASTERARNYNSPAVPEPNLDDFIDAATGNFRTDPGGVRNYRDEYVEALEAHLDSFRPEDFTPAAYDRDFTGFDVRRPNLDADDDDVVTDADGNFATAQDRANFEAALLRYQQAFVPDAFRFQVVHSDATAIHEYGIHANEGAFQYLVEGFRAFRTLATVNLGRKTLPDPLPVPDDAAYDGYHDLEVFDLNFQALVVTTDPDNPDAFIFERDADDNLTRGDFIDQEALRLLVIRTEKLLQTAKDELELILNRNALVQSGLRLRLDRVKTDIGETQKRVDGIRAIDEDATAVFLSNTRLQIEASYRAITQANELSLLNFLR